ncbi:SDR family NAD(P)-dependent oxidoreductase [Streptomyces sp. NBC_01530]|uniref:SDR family NAD(P)-dependent oxidoreductase n=1 Tax=Streptomyces sp. NBC_01530 TaxID=2903895 RepID=UPI00386B041F
MDLRLGGRRAIVAGGSRGIGLAAAQAFAAEGVRVAFAARDASVLKSARDQVAAHRARHGAGGHEAQPAQARPGLSGPPPGAGAHGPDRPHGRGGQRRQRLRRPHGTSTSL